MDATTSRSFGRASLGVLLLYGVLPVMFGIGYLIPWRSESLPLIVFAVLSPLGGVVMVSSGLWLLVTAGRSHRALWSGGIASILCAANLAWGVMTETVPCSGPA